MRSGQHISVATLWIAIVVSVAIAAVQAGGDGEGEEKKSFFYFTFIDVWRFTVFWMLLWVGGKAAEAVR
jgi:hypothetical protein